MNTIIALAALAAAVTALVIQQRRYKTLRRRLERQRVAAAVDHNMLTFASGQIAQIHPAGGAATRFTLEMRAQHGEDVFVLALFPGLRDGFYIEAGAFDGYIYANTYALEALGWSGLLVEPLPDRAETARRARPFARVEETALVAPGATETVRLQVGSPAGMEHELCSYVVPDQPTEASRRADEILKKGGVVEVRTATLDQLLAEHKGPVDVAFIDLEGLEQQALEGFDLDRFRPRLLVVEDHTRQDDSDLGRYLDRRGYQLVGWLSYNRLHVRKDDQALADRARWLLHESDREDGQPGVAPDNRAKASQTQS